MLVAVSGRKPVCPLSFVVPDFQYESLLPESCPEFTIMALTQSFFVE